MFKKTKPNQPFKTCFERERGDAVIRGQNGEDRAATAVPVAEWPVYQPDLRGTVTKLIDAVQSDLSGSDGRPAVIITDDRVTLHEEYVAALSMTEAASLGLPSNASLVLDLATNGLIHDPNFTIRSTWLRADKRRISVRVCGAFVYFDGVTRRLPDPLYTIARNAAELAGPLDDSRRFAALERLQRCLPEGLGATLQANGYLTETRIQYASSFSLKLGVSDPFDFDPILFGQTTKQQAQDGDNISDEKDSILSRRAQKIFAEDRFRKSDGQRPAYVLRDGEYVFIDPALRPVLGEVRRLQSEPVDVRRAFVINPRRVLAERMKKAANAEVDLEFLFVETEQYSERVTGVDLWSRPVLPWLKPKPGTWLPEAYGVRIGDRYITLDPREVRDLIVAVKEAIGRGEPAIKIQSVDLPATEGTVDALERLTYLITPIEGHAASGGQTDTKFLVVRQNFAEVEYQPLEGEGRLAPSGELLIPGQVRTPLKPHQIEGLRWLTESVRHEKAGGLLADDMGLGKTLQAIAFMAWLQVEAREGRRQTQPFLVVAPTGLLNNWRKEIETHLAAPYLGEIVLAFGSNLTGLKEEGGLSDRDISAGRAVLDSGNWRNAGLVLTTYETMRDYHFSLAKSQFDLIIFDEAQKLKNPASQLRRAAATLNANYRLALTGTPVENRLQDLWSIMDIVTPGLLGSSRDFEKEYGSENSAKLKELQGFLTKSSAERPAYMLRRLKDQVSDGLPSKTIHRWTDEDRMPPVQAIAYEALVQRAMASRAVMDTRDGMLSVLHAMRGASLHPIHPDNAPDDLDQYASHSARLKRMLLILDEIAAKREKVLIFIEDLAMQEKLASLIQWRFKLRDMPPRINGSVPGPKRQANVDQFQRETGKFDVMLLSPKAGGVGLTIAAANHVIHLSRWWNPAVEDQSTDRVYRIGQKRDVHVYLPMAIHPDASIGPYSFDLRLDALLERKRTLSKTMLIPADGGNEDIGNLFNEVSGAGEVEEEPKPESNSAPVTEYGAAPSGEISSSAEPPSKNAGSGPAQVSQDALGSAPNNTTRSKLTLPTVPGQPVPLVWRAKSGDSRPLNELLGKFHGLTVDSVEVVDPYALASPDNRDAQAAFAKHLMNVAASIREFRIRYLPPDWNAQESESELRKDMGQRWIRSLGPKATSVRLDMRPKNRSPGHDFHDRSVTIKTVNSRNVQSEHQIILGRGLLGLMDDRFECSVIYVPPARPTP